MKMQKLKLITAMIVGSTILTACSSPFDQLADEINSFMSSDPATEEEAETVEDPAEDEEPAGEDTTAEETEEELDPIYEKIDYSHLYGQGEETTITEGENIVGEDIAPGRYSITSDGEYTGYLSIYDEEDRYITGEVLVNENSNDTPANYPTEVLAYIDEGDKIEVTNDDSFVFTPVDSSFDEELSPGMYVVGHDIEAGDYRITTEETEQSGHVHTFQTEAYTTGRHAVGNPEYGGKESFVISFDEGDIVEISGVENVSLENLE